jgi:hypothetical protein
MASVRPSSVSSAREQGGTQRKKIFMTTMAAGVVFLGLTTPAVAETSGTQRFLLIFRGPDVARWP